MVKNPLSLNKGNGQAYKMGVFKYDWKYVFIIGSSL